MLCYWLLVYSVVLHFSKHKLRVGEERHEGRPVDGLEAVRHLLQAVVEHCDGRAGTGHDLLVRVS